MSKVFSQIGRGRALQGAAAGVVVLGLLLWWLLPLGEDPPSGTITFSTGTPVASTRSTAPGCATSSPRTCPVST